MVTGHRAPATGPPSFRSQPYQCTLCLEYFVHVGGGTEGEETIARDAAGTHGHSSIAGKR